MAATVILAGAAITYPPARYCCLAVATAAGFALTVLALNALVVASLSPHLERRRSMAWPALAACATVIEMAMLSMLKAWLSVV